MPDSVVPVEPPGRRRRLPRPQHPGGEDAVEQRLHQRRMEEARALLALEADAQRLLQRQPHRLERRRIVSRLDPRQPVAGVGGEQPSQVLRLRERGPMRQHAGEIFDEARAGRAGEGAGLLHVPPKLVRAFCQPEGLELLGAPGVCANQHEIAEVGYQHQPILFPVTADLGAISRKPSRFGGGLDLDHAVLRRLPLARLALLHLLCRVEAEIGIAHALVRQVAYRKHSWLQRTTHGVQQVRQRRIVGKFSRATARRAYLSQLVEVGLDCSPQLLTRSRHGILVVERGPERKRSFGV